MKDCLELERRLADPACSQQFDRQLAELSRQLQPASGQAAAGSSSTSSSCEAGAGSSSRQQLVTAQQLRSACCAKVAMLLASCERNSDRNFPAEVVAATRSAAAKLQQLEPDSPRSLNAALTAVVVGNPPGMAGMREEGSALDAIRGMQRAVGLARQQRSDYCSNQLAGCVH